MRLLVVKYRIRRPDRPQERLINPISAGPSLIQDAVLTTNAATLRPLASPPPDAGNGTSLNANLWAGEWTGLPR